MTRSDQRAQGNRAILTFLFAVGAGLARVPLRPTPAAAAGMVGAGTRESCTDAAFDAALAGGGLVTFNCGGPATIDISTGTGTKTIAADATVDGGGLITISGGNTVRVFTVNTGVTFTVQHLTISNANSTGSPGGGIDNEGGTLVVTDTTFAGNSAVPGPGGGIFSTGTLTVTNSTFSGNSAGVGGGIGNPGTGTLTVTNSTFSGNSAGIGGGGIANGSGTLTVSNSTFSGNSASEAGGGIVNLGTLTVTNSTLCGNSTSEVGGGIDNEGGTLTVTNSTLCGNSASEGGGGIANTSGTVTVTDTIVAGSTPGDNCSGGAITDGGHNIDDGTTCGFKGTACSSSGGSSFCSTNPQLDPVGLANNGGPTDTIALEPDSPAINAGDPSVCANPPVNGVDQRGFARPGIGHTQCSIGAYEADAVPSIVTATPTDTPTTITATPTDTPPTIIATPTETSTTIAATATPSDTPTTIPATPTAKPSCTGDCDGNGVVVINELILGVNIVLAIQPDTACPAFADSEGMVDIAQLIRGVNNALGGCGIAPMPTATSTPTASLTSTPTATPTPSLTATAPALRTASVTPSATPTCFFPPRPTPTVSFTLHPDTPKVGDTVQVSAFVSTGNAGPPGSCTVSGTSPVFEDVRITACAGGLGGGTVTFEMKAVQAGSATVRLGFSFEIAVEICGPYTVIYEFVQGSGIVEVTVAPSDTPVAAPTVTPTASPTAQP